MPHFAPWPQVSAPLYLRWLLFGAGLWVALYAYHWSAAMGADPRDVAGQRERFASLILSSLLLWA